MQRYTDLLNAAPRDDYETALITTYNWAAAFENERGHSPTIFEIHQGLGISYQTARRRLIAMERLGWIAPRHGLKRNIQLKGIGVRLFIETTTLGSPRRGT